MAHLGRTPRRFHFPDDPRAYFELQKLSSPMRDDYIAMIERGDLPSRLQRFVWDLAVTGFCLASDRGYVSYPTSNDDRNNVKEAVWDGLEERESLFLTRAFLVQNNFVPKERIALMEAVLKVGRENLPPELQGLLSDVSATPTPELQRIIEGIVGPVASVGEVLGNSLASSAPSSTAGDPATPVGDAPKPDGS